MLLVGHFGLDVTAWRQLALAMRKHQCSYESQNLGFADVFC